MKKLFEKIMKLIGTDGLLHFVVSFGLMAIGCVLASGLAIIDTLFNLIKYSDYESR